MQNLDLYILIAGIVFAFLLLILVLLLVQRARLLAQNENLAAHCKEKIAQNTELAQDLEALNAYKDELEDAKKAYEIRFESEQKVSEELRLKAKENAQKMDDLMKEKGELASILAGLKVEISNANSEISDLRGENVKLEGRASEFELANGQIKDEKGELERENAALKEKMSHYESEFKDNLKRIESESERQKSELLKSFDEKIIQISEKMLNQNQEKISAASDKIVKSALENQIKPLKEELARYQKATNEINTEFRANFANLKDQTLNVMKSAENLASALKGNKKAAGNWGELQLDLVLENSGLVLGENYEKQVACKDENGKMRYIDVVVKFDETKRAIIDAKCSIVNFANFYEAESEAQRLEFAKALAKDIRAHVDIFASKEYQNLLDGGFEYVFMFIPSENILSAALLGDKTIYQYAYEKGIFITTPMTLLMALKTVYICWRNLKSDENAMKILDIGGKMVDKMASFVDSFNKIQAQYKTLGNSINSARAQLTGIGGVMSNFTKIENLSSKSTKKLPQISENELEFED